MFEPCPCASGKPYLSCCGPLHLGQAQAGSPEALMRARYVAYVRADGPYLLRTWAPETRPLALGDLADREWTGLEILDAPPPDGDHGVVRFVARFRHQGLDCALRETSRFRRARGRWLYVDGDVV